MEDACRACEATASPGKWKQRFAFAGAFIFCPCHLPVTMGAVLLLLGAAGVPLASGWAKPLIYAVFGLAFFTFLVLFIRILYRRRKLREALETEHVAHHAFSVASSPTTAPTAALDEG